MSYKTSLNYYKKYLTEKKFPSMIYSKSKNTSLKFDSNLLPPKQLNFLSITHNNLKKYATSKRKYNILLINSIVFDLRIHKVAIFKNNLLWDESSEFLKRFYTKNESTERIPKISEYYQKYTLFPPVYFGLEGLIIIIMNKWTKRKKGYLEYVEDHEEEREKRKQKIKISSFEPLINPSLISNKASSKSIISKNTLELSKYENEPNKNIINNYNKTIYNNSRDKKRENNKSLSLSEIIDDLSSQYSIIINNDINNNTINDENDKKFKKIQKKANKKNLKKERRNEINFSKIRNIYYYNTCNNSKINNIAQSSKMKTIDSSTLNKKDNKFILISNNNNLIKRNNFPLPIQIQKYQKKVMNTQNCTKKSPYLPNNFIFCKKNNIQGTIRVNTISNVIEKNKIIKDNNILEKGENHSSKKLSSNFIKDNPMKNPINSIKKKNSHNAINSETLNTKEKTLNNKNYNLNKILKLKSFVQIKRKSSSEISNIFKSLKINKPLTSRNIKNQQLLNIKGKTSASNVKSNQISINDENKEIYNRKIISDNEKTQKRNKKIYLEDPFLYKLTQLTKKKQIPFTTANSLNTIKNEQYFFQYGINSTIENLEILIFKTNNSEIVDISPDNFINWVTEIKKINESYQKNISVKVFNKSDQYSYCFNYGMSFIKFNESDLNIILFESILNMVDYGDNLISILMLKYGDIYLEFLFYDKNTSSQIPNDNLLKENWKDILSKLYQFNERVDNIGNRYYYVIFI